MTQNLSPAAQTALINAGSSRVGVQVGDYRLSGAEVFEELKNAGLIGDNDGLTRQGSIVREKLVAAALDAAFG
jgi:hypothetical protein